MSSLIYYKRHSVDYYDIQIFLWVSGQTSYIYIYIYIERERERETFVFKWVQIFKMKNKFSFKLKDTTISSFLEKDTQSNEYC